MMAFIKQEENDLWWKAFYCLKPSIDVGRITDEGLGERLAVAVHIEIGYRVKFANEAIEAGRREGRLS